MRRSTIIGAVLIGGLALAGCTPAEAPSDQPPAPGTPPPATAQHNAGQHGAGEHSETDREFAQQLLANRQQVLELTQLAQSNAQSADAKALAGELQQSAQLQVGQLNAFLTSAAGQESGSAPEDTADQADGTGQQSTQQLDQLKQVTGAQFDQQWKQAVQALEQSAAQLARSEQEEGQSQAMRKLAEDFLAGQQDVLTKLNAL
ncbi:Uncharacterized conserved protein, DUF305 family [Saccharopolyspora antimicrobica]|uniref:Uncharacterized conserved protein, DUF305 family n=1 Tax=Saccharopolyspora antimicrobica TaxID=455193 RepID=A0A1I5M4T5_9PSEU|nr:DUF305 domain-containing protein [Saccharopolyspora antimicrobica]RKT83139.1 uncharacterized protein (DUF305 family) [Saccharopolyspora antimicrobica]SFP03956.1 Uncharacterized conserved protein, DUF305 family [Saccharopolyspora antimicrobica]